MSTLITVLQAISNAFDDLSNVINKRNRVLLSLSCIVLAALFLNEFKMTFIILNCLLIALTVQYMK